MHTWIWQTTLCCECVSHTKSPFHVTHGENASPIICYCCRCRYSLSVTIALHCQWYWKYHQNSTFTSGIAVTGKCSLKPLLLLLDHRNKCTPCTHDIFCLYRFEPPYAWKRAEKGETERERESTNENENDKTKIRFDTSKSYSQPLTNNRNRNSK